MNFLTPDQQPAEYAEIFCYIPINMSNYGDGMAVDHVELSETIKII
jgi:hypothetical protein